MNCPECGNTMTSARCSCGYEPVKSYDGDRRSVKSSKTGVRYYLCEWDGRCNIPVCTDPNGDKLCRFHKSCERAPDQAYNFESFKSFHERMLSFKYQYGWWGKPSEELWPVILGDRRLLA